jgi:sugar phosphate isomerase/epimerase
MYKNLNAQTLGISGRQSDLIELAMTYGFQGLDIDAVDLQRRASRSDFQKASRFLMSSGMRVSGFDVPCDLDADDVAFEEALKVTQAVVAVAGMAKARAGYLRIPSATNRAPFPQYFEWIKSRLDRLSGVFAENQVLLGLYFSTFAEDRNDRQYPFIQDVNGSLALLQSCESKSIGLLIDTYHWTVGKGSWELLSSLSASQVAGLNIADLAHLPDIKDSTASLKLISGSHGTVDNIRFAKTLADKGYDGPITSSPSSVNLGAITRDSIVAKAQDVLDSTLSAAGIQTQTRRPEIIAAQARSAPEMSNLEEFQ